MKTSLAWAASVPSTGWWLRRKRTRASPETPELVNDGEAHVAGGILYDLFQIKAATNNFSSENQLGKGGFGAVYKAKLEDGMEVAVKRLSSMSRQGGREFRNEVLLIAKLQHRNLVRLLGSCVDAEEKILVYEYMPNRSLDSILFGPNRNEQLPWGMRVNIINGITKGLLYLHKDSCLKIIHRDLKAANILLDKDMNPKIADFGLAKLFEEDQSDDITSKPAGTLGYMSPEYIYGGKYSEKSDVYSFVVLLLEIVSGRKNSYFEPSLLAHAWQLHQAKKAEELVDEALACPKDAALRCINIGLLCAQANASARPYMSSVVIMLATPSLALPPPSPPGFFNLGPPPSDEITITELEGR